MYTVAIVTLSVFCVICLMGWMSVFRRKVKPYCEHVLKNAVHKENGNKEIYCIECGELLTTYKPDKDED